LTLTDDELEIPNLDLNANFATHPMTKRVEVATTVTKTEAPKTNPTPMDSGIRTSDSSFLFDNLLWSLFILILPMIMI
jgi:hypothetical protein